ncbi:DUF6904 family protein [Alicyclobacillus acidocaldarius]|uniref:DUF6904 family protein n=1 Tax=Alicyclobacillus acidocaldarius TaxID=405212 RepID=UPI0035BE2705
MRHALQGHRRVELYPNGLTEDMMRFHGLIAPQENVRCLKRCTQKRCLWLPH